MSSEDLCTYIPETEYKVLASLNLNQRFVDNYMLNLEGLLTVEPVQNLGFFAEKAGAMDLEEWGDDPDDCSELRSAASISRSYDE